MVAKTLLSADEFLKVADGFGRCELIRGEIVRMSPAAFEHSFVVANVIAILRAWAKQSQLGRVVGGEAGLLVARDPDTVRGADAGFVSYKRIPRGPRPRGFLATPPELIVEVLGVDKGWREVTEKAGQYLAMGVLRVWVVDPARREVHVFRPDGPPAVFGEDAILADEAILPGLSTPVSEFFAD